MCHLKQMIFQPPPIQTTRAPDSFKSCKGGGVLTITMGNRTFEGLTTDSFQLLGVLLRLIKSVHPTLFAS